MRDDEPNPDGLVTRRELQSEMRSAVMIAVLVSLFSMFLFIGLMMHYGAL